VLDALVARLVPYAGRHFLVRRRGGDAIDLLSKLSLAVGR
jgi:hypothetical protein